MLGRILVLPVDRTRPVKVFENREVGPGSHAEALLSGLGGYSAIVAYVRVRYSPGASEGARVVWLYSPDGANFDSVEEALSAGNCESLTFEAGGTRQRTLLIPIFAPYVKILVENLDPGESLFATLSYILLR